MRIRKSGTPIEVVVKNLKAVQGQARAVLSKNLAVEARTQVMNEFRESRDPYGELWKPVARGGQPLLKTGRMRASFRGEATASGFRISSNVIYVTTHNYGATIRAKSSKYLKFKGGDGGFVQTEEVTIPKRQMVPEGRIGPIWTKAFVSVTNHVLKGILERGFH